MSRKLSAEMRSIVRSTARYVEVQACPGSGKTTAAVARVRHLLKHNPESKITLLSFSNSAVDNLVERLTGQGVNVGERVVVSTCHALARRIAVTPPSPGDAKEDARYFKAMLKAGIKVLGRKRLSARTKDRVEIHHLIVDEYQDCSALQRRLIALLAQRARTTVVLGDRMQAIYCFAGVRYCPLADVLPGTETLPLSLSHRLTQENAALANALGRPMHAPKIRSERRGKNPILVEATELPTLTDWVANRVHKLVGKGVSPSEIAVLGRNRGTARPVANALRALGINSTLLGQTTGHMEQVLDVIAILAVVEEADDGSSGAARPSPGIRGRRRKLEAHLDTALAEALGTELANRSNWRGLVTEVRKLIESRSVDPSGRFSACVAAYLRLLGGVRADKALRSDLNGWVPVCRDKPTAEAMQRHALSMMGDTAVTITNIHQSKGMQWDYVFVFGVTDGVLPDFRAAAQGTTDNERSLLYVAITRPRKRLWLCHAPMFGRQARRTFDKLSSLLADPARRSLMKRLQLN